MLEPREVVSCETVVSTLYYSLKIIAFIDKMLCRLAWCLLNDKEC